MAKYLVETYYTCSFKVSHYLDDIDDKNIQNTIKNGIPVYSLPFGKTLFKKFNIRVSVISPGFIKTPLTDKNEFPMPFLRSANFAAEKIFLDFFCHICSAC